MAAIAATVARFLSACDMEETGVAGAAERFCPSGQMRASRICRLVGWEIFVIGVGCANRHFILWRICGKSPDGANADEPYLLDGMFKRGEESAGVAEMFCPAGQAPGVALGG